MLFEAMKEALFYEKLPLKPGESAATVRCSLCPHNCVIAAGKRGICAVRENQGGTLIALTYGKLVAAHVDPIEKKPLFNFMPGTLTYTIATAGCNFSCAFCQNFDISQLPRTIPLEADPEAFPGENASPEAVVAGAVDSGCPSISYSYTEPTIYYEFAYDCAKLARKKGLKNIFVTNGFINPEPLEQISPFLDAANVDLKSFSEDFYHKTCGGKLAPVLACIKQMIKNKLWVEITTLVIPGLNDSDQELRQIAEWIKTEAGPEAPWHVSAFFPTYRMTDRLPTPKETVLRAQRIGLETGLKHVYTGNIR